MIAKYRFGNGAITHESENFSEATSLIPHHRWSHHNTTKSGFIESRGEEATRTA